MCKPFIKVEYDARRGEPYNLIRVLSYTLNKEVKIEQLNDDLIDIDDTLQITAPKKVSTYPHIIILALIEASYQLHVLIQMTLLPSYGIDINSIGKLK